MALRIANLLGANLMAGGRQGLAIQQGALFAQAQAALGEPAHGQRVDPVFFPREPVWPGVSCDSTGITACTTSGPIEFLRHEVHAATVLAVAGFEGALMGMQPFVARQQRGMDIQQTPLVMANEIGAEDAHEPGKDHQVRFMGIDPLCQGLVEAFAIGIGLVIESTSVWMPAWRARSRP